MEKDFTVGSSFKLEAVFGLQSLKVVDFTIADSADVTTDERLVSRLG
jgi:hypothetical protein